MTTQDTVFRRDVGSRSAGLMEYILLVPVLTITSWIVAGVILGGLVKWGRIPEEVIVVVGVAVFALSPVAVTWFAVREYRHRAGGVVTVGNGCVKIEGRGKSISVPFDEVREVRLVPNRCDARCVLVMAEGKECALPADIVPFSAVQAVLEKSLLPLLAQQMGRELLDGESFRLRESPLRSWLRMVRGAFLVVVGGMLVVVRIGRAVGAPAAVDAWCELRRGWRGRKTDFQFDRQGIRRSGSRQSDDVHRWSALRGMQFDEVGFVLYYADGRTVTASVFAENFWPLSVWLKAQGNS